MHRLRKAAIVGVLVSVAGVGLAACGGTERSVDAYCTYFYTEGANLRERFTVTNVEADPLAAFSTVLSSPHDMAVFLDHLADRAPDEIVDDVQTLSDGFQKLADGLGDAAADPLSGLAKGLVNGLANSGAERRFNEYTAENCGPPPGDKWR